MLTEIPRDFPLPGFLRILSRQPDVASEIHQAFYRVTWDNASPVERAILVWQMLRWPFLTLGGICLYTFRNGAIVARRTGKPIWKQVVEQACLAVRHAIEPRAYYAFELFHQANRQQVGSYLQRHETKDALYLYLKAAWRVPVTPANNKLDFERYLMAQKLPTVRTVAAFAKGERIDAASSLILPQEDLFVKPRNGRGGVKCMRYRFVGPGWEAVGSPDIISATDLIADIKASSRKTPCIVQRRCQVHQALADLSGDTLTTVRVLSMTDTSGEVQALYAAFRMPRSHGAVVDNFHAGGIAASVDIATGALGEATDLGNDQALGWVDRHPANAAAIRGRVLPHWPAVVDLVKRAHGQAFRDRVMLGWDIAITDDGPIIVEGNAAPDLDIIQRVCRTPLGNDRFGELLLEHLRAAERMGVPAIMTPEPA